jgi:DNA polymerase I-like protein with 3'-5' exonuclease and polymerase domains
MMKNKQDAIDKWGPVKRAHTHAAANAVLQGSSADITKQSMVNGYNAGIYDILGYPLVTVHDELGFSIKTGDPIHEEAAKEMHNIMMKAYKLEVPVLVSVGRGNSWGTAG